MTSKTAHLELSRMLEALAQRLSQHYAGWFYDYTGMDDPIQSAHTLVSNAFSVALTQWQLGGTDDVVELRRIVLEQLYVCPLAYWAAKDGFAYWNPSKESYASFKTEHPNSEVFVAARPQKVKTTWVLF